MKDNFILVFSKTFLSLIILITPIIANIIIINAMIEFNIQTWKIFLSIFVGILSFIPMLNIVKWFWTIDIEETMYSDYQQDTNQEQPKNNNIAEVKGFVAHVKPKKDVSANV